MPRVVEVPGGTPVNVEKASTAFRSPVRIHLIRHYLTNPGSAQHGAAEALGLTKRVVSVNTRELIKVGVLVEEPSGDKRLSNYRVDVDRLNELLAAVRDFTTKI